MIWHLCALQSDHHYKCSCHTSSPSPNLPTLLHFPSGDHWSKAMANLDGVLKRRENTRPIKVCIVKAMVFPAVMHDCESWTIKKVECQSIVAFELWCWRRLLRVPWTARRSNQSILREINPECSLEGLMLKWKLQYFGHLMRANDSLEKFLMLGNIESRKKRGCQRMRCWTPLLIQWTWTWANSRRWWGTGRAGVLQSMGLQRVGHDWTTKQQPLICSLFVFCLFICFVFRFHICVKS